MSTYGLFTYDPIVAQNFWLELDGEIVTSLISVSGLDIEVAVSPRKIGFPKAVQNEIKVMGNRVQASDLSLARVAPLDSKGDKMWQWFNAIRNGGMSATNRASQRKNGSVVMFDTTLTEVSRFNFFNAWPSKISTDQLSVESAEVVKETITLVIERLERVK
ncbi:MAG: phage tail protein [Kineosporiaceae bacterium]